jgi:FtsP/CotA-like multicopper oxidase with cupredoxin domain
MQPVAIKYEQRPSRTPRAVWVIGIGLCFCLQPAMAEELGQPPVCSAATATQFKPAGICTVNPLGGGRNDIHVNLTAASAEIEAGGYKVITENYNGNYLAPIIEAMPGDTVSATLVNALPKLQSSAHSGMLHGDPDNNPTNLHYFHGGIVTPKNARPKAAELGDGDNVYVLLKSGKNAQGELNKFYFNVPIPGDGELDARVLERPGNLPTMAHPFGLNWYHSHQHGISSNQVMGGMSGLLSVGEATANVKAACQKDPADQSKCLNDVDKDTADLRKATKVQYVLLRDLPVKKIGKPPTEANGDTATFDPDSRDFPFGTAPCGILKLDNSGVDPAADVKLRTGFCQRDKDSAVLFTVNGQRFPTIKVPGGQNLLLRVGDLSANVPYWLELTDDKGGKGPKLTILSLDGVVPATPAAPGQTDKPVLALEDDNILLMPAARAEIYIRNDQESHSAPQTYVLRTKQHIVGTDEWPEIQLAQIVLEPNVLANKTLVALNAPVAKVSHLFVAKTLVKAKEALPEGCVRDLDPALHEFRRVTFSGKTKTSDEKIERDWSVKTEIIQPKEGPIQDEFNYMPGDAAKTSVALDIGFKTERGVPFEEYLLKDGLVDWTKAKPPHPCIRLDNVGSHKQLWVLFNNTETLHNFHIHQMKFRLATREELNKDYFIDPTGPSHTCDPSAGCATPDYNFYDEKASIDDGAGGTRRWHDTIPLPPFGRVYVVMSFDATQQIGRFVFHCHILKHEDNGLMAPIEVWDPQAVSALQ